MVKKLKTGIERDITYIFSRERKIINSIISDLKYHINSKHNCKDFKLRRLDELERIINKNDGVNYEK